MIIAALSLLLMAGDTPSAPAPAPVAQPASAPAPAAVPAVPTVAQAAMTDRQKVVCKSIEVTGSRFGRQECHTRAEWDEMARNARDFVNKATSGACANPSCH